MSMCESRESRKKRLDSAWLNPKHLYNRQSAAELRIEEGSTTIPLRGVGLMPKYFLPKLINKHGKDMV